MKKKIVFAINYFHPDFASTGQLLTELCLDLQDHFDITVIAVQPSESADARKAKSGWFERDRLEQIEIIRVKTPLVDKTNKASRFKFIAAYFALCLIAVLREKNVDIIYTISSPPVLGGLIGTIGKVLKRTKHIYNIQDFNPEQAEAVSYTDKKWVFNLARAVDNWSCRHADHIITVGVDMQETLVSRFGGVKVPSNSVINNWTNEQEIIPLTKEHPRVRAFLEQYGLTNKFIVMYSGNMGLYYDLENMISVTEPFRDTPDLAFVFIGEGAVKPAMQQFVRDHGLEAVAHFLPFQPKEQIKYSLNAADVHLVVNQKGIKGVSVPSKIYGVMASGKPILGVLEQGSEAERLIRESGSGVVVEPQQYDDVARAIRQLHALPPDELTSMGLSGRDYLDRHLKRELSIAKYKTLLQSV